mmetsp:Transcript_27818/g.52648  ORF Transcript_27818/g.52648 Transcript_27818/m.52648 type:complete len:312 (+) Transcript_27818:3378-4313(+)
MRGSSAPDAVLSRHALPNAVPTHSGGSTSTSILGGVLKSPPCAAVFASSPSPNSRSCVAVVKSSYAYTAPPLTAAELLSKEHPERTMPVDALATFASRYTAPPSCPPALRTKLASDTNRVDPAEAYTAPPLIAAALLRNSDWRSSFPSITSSPEGWIITAPPDLPARLSSKLVPADNTNWLKGPTAAAPAYQPAELSRRRMSMGSEESSDLLSGEVGSGPMLHKSASIKAPPLMAARFRAMLKRPGPDSLMSLLVHATPPPLPWSVELLMTCTFPTTKQWDCTIITAPPPLSAVQESRVESSMVACADSAR